jgi:hypothetical protein
LRTLAHSFAVVAVWVDQLTAKDAKNPQSSAKENLGKYRPTPQLDEFAANDYNAGLK